MKGLYILGWGRGRRALLACCLGLFTLSTARGQESEQAAPAAGLREVSLSEVSVAPGAVDTKGWLLLNPDIQLELDGAVNNLYNFKFDKADRQFRSLRRRYPEHPMAYFLLGLSTWWKIMPSNVTSRQYDKLFYAYMDTAITKAQVLYDADEQNYEASFFLAAAYGFDARLHAERSDWRKATVSSKRSLSYLQKSREANGLSPEFTFGEALFNYYSVWIGEEFVWLRPLLLLFPKGSRETGLAQLNSVAQNGFYTAPEARYFQLRILGSERENNTAEAFLKARALVRDFPDNACFARTYASHAFTEGYFAECEQASRGILDKLNQGFTGYDAHSGRVAAYYLGYLMQNRRKDLAQAQDYYRRCLVFCETVGKTKGGYYLFSLTNLARIADSRRNVAEARRYFEQVATIAGRKSEVYREARDYLQKNPVVAAGAKAPGGLTVGR